MSPTNIASKCRIASIATDDTIILPHDANPGRMLFSKRTRSRLSKNGAHGSGKDFVKLLHHETAVNVRLRFLYRLECFFNAAQGTTDI
jgi:hypothetical protein